MNQRPGAIEVFRITQDVHNLWGHATAFGARQQRIRSPRFWIGFGTIGKREHIDGIEDIEKLLCIPGGLGKSMIERAPACAAYFIDDAIECLLTILENSNGCASRRIFNIGNPGNCISIRDLAQRTIRIAQEFPVLRDNARATEIVDVSAGEYYGKYYQDIQVRVPNIEAAKRDLGWAPTTDMDTAIRRTIEFYVKQEGFGTRAAAMAAI